MNTDEIVDKLLLLVVLVGAALIMLRDLRTLLRVIASRRQASRRWTKSPLRPSGDPKTSSVLSFGAGPTRACTYTGAARLGVLLVEALGVASIVVSLVAAVVLLALAFQSNTYTPIDFIKCLLLGDLAVGWFLGAGLINLLPTVWTTEEGVIISVYFTGRVLIPWADVLEVRRWTLLPGSYIVRAKRVTPMHQLYGWLAGTRSPGFIVLQSIDGYAQLSWELERRIPTRAEAYEGGR